MCKHIFSMIDIPFLSVIWSVGHGTFFLDSMIRDLTRSQQDDATNRLNQGHWTSGWTHGPTWTALDGWTLPESQLKRLRRYVALLVTKDLLLGWQEAFHLQTNCVSTAPWIEKICWVLRCIKCSHSSVLRGKKQSRSEENSPPTCGQVLSSDTIM